MAKLSIKALNKQCNLLEIIFFKLPFFFYILVLLTGCRRGAPKSTVTSVGRSIIFNKQTFIPDSANISFVSWNIEKFGNNEAQERIETIARIINEFDLVAIQEVNRKTGAKAVARLKDVLNRMGSKWDSRISDPTDSPGQKGERYAFLWKPSRVSLIGRPTLDNQSSQIFYREPYLADFRFGDKDFMIVNYHSRKYIDKPEEEIIAFYDYQDRFEDKNIIIAGDFNSFTSNNVFIPLYEQGFTANLNLQKTTLKRKCKIGGSYLKNPIDFILYRPNEIETRKSGVIDFVGGCDFLDESRNISDHLPVFITFEVL